ncbi:TPA: hypothetical protein ROX88_003014 [Bacillus pseudomycoides]|nr:hypothetical protein [Bacillus pseudomycoides]
MITEKEQEFCSCGNNGGWHSVSTDFGYWYCYNDCNKKIEGEFHYDDEPIDVY